MERLGERRTVDVEREASLLDGGSETTRKVSRQARQVGRLVRCIRPPRLDPGEIEQGVHELEETQRVSVKEIDALAFVRVARWLRPHFVDGAQHEGERRAKFVAYVAEERCFCAIDLRERLGAPASFLVGARVREAGA